MGDHARNIVGRIHVKPSVEDTRCRIGCKLIGNDWVGSSHHHLVLCLRNYDDRSLSFEYAEHLFRISAAEFPISGSIEMNIVRSYGTPCSTDHMGLIDKPWHSGDHFIMKRTYAIHFFSHDFSYKQRYVPSLKS